MTTSIVLDVNFISFQQCNAYNISYFFTSCVVHSLLTSLLHLHPNSCASRNAVGLIHVMVLLTRTAM